jgi:hypothetical protein
VRLEGLGQLNIHWPYRKSSRDLRVCSVVPEPTMLPRAPIRNSVMCIRENGNKKLEKREITHEILSFLSISSNTVPILNHR